MAETIINHNFLIGEKVYIVECYTNIYSRTIKTIQFDEEDNVSYGCTSNLLIPEREIDSNISNKYSTFNRNWMKAFSSEELAFKCIADGDKKWIADVIKHNRKFAEWYKLNNKI